MTKPKKKKSYLKYSSMGYEMAVLMVIAVFLGKYLDNYFNNEKQIATASLVILFMAGFMYKLVKDLSRDDS